jgi:hypothetical protein
MGWVVNHTARPLYPRERHGTHRTVGLVAPRAGLDGCGKTRSHRHSNPGPPNLYRLSYPGPRLSHYKKYLYNTKNICYPLDLRIATQLQAPYLLST